MSKPDSNLLSALQEARDKGFIHDLFLNEEGEFLTHSEEIVEPLIIEIVRCPMCDATIYLVADEDNAGTWVHFWEA